MQQRISKLIDRPVIMASLIAGFLVLVGLLTGAADAADAKQPPNAQYYARVDTGRLNVREGSAVGFRVLTIIDEGDYVTLLGRNEDESWARVRLENGLLGWVSTRYIESNTVYTPLPVVLGSVVEPYAWVDTGKVNLRAGPAETYRIVATIDQYELVSLIARNRNGHWLLIRYQTSIIGWANAAFIGREIPSTAGLPVSDFIVPDKPLGTPTPSGTPSLVGTPIPPGLTPLPTSIP